MPFEIYDNNINYYHYQPGSNTIIVYFKHITHIVEINTHYKCMGHVIIPKPNVSRLVGINCRFYVPLAINYP